MEKWKDLIEEWKKANASPESSGRGPMELERRLARRRLGHSNWWHRRGYLVVSGTVDWWGSRFEKCVLRIFLFLGWGMMYAG
jgi:hypothetical protein